MHVLRTGLQGNGKTLNTIKEVDEKAAKEGRTVYYCNITGFKPDHPAIKATWIEFTTPEKWFELPKNAIIVIDEAQTWFRVRPQGSKVPDYASRLEIMRKDGHELHCITQSPKLIDAHMRELCNSHIHYHRGNGGSVIKRWVFQKPELGVNSSKLEFQNGESSRITIDKTYFGCYESVKEGTGHHFKFRPPKAMYVLGICALLVVAGVAKIYWSRFVHEPDPVAEIAPVDHGEKLATNGSSVGAAPPRVSTQDYIDARIPRIPDVPSSAPIYDDITKPVAYPKPFCVASKDEFFVEKNRKRMVTGYRDGRLHGCRCNSQQGTRLDISFEACMAYVDQGAFDPAIPDRQPLAKPGQAPQPVASGPGVGTAAAPRPVAGVTVVENTEYASRPWR